MSALEEFASHILEGVNRGLDPIELERMIQEERKALLATAEQIKEK